MTDPTPEVHGFAAAPTAPALPAAPAAAPAAPPASAARAPADVVYVGIPTKLRPVILEPGRQYTVSEVLALAGIDPAGFNLMITGNVVELDTIVTPGKNVMLLKNIAGG